MAVRGHEIEQGHQIQQAGEEEEDEKGGKKERTRTQQPYFMSCEEFKQKFCVSKAEIND